VISGGDYTWYRKKITSDEISSRHSQSLLPVRSPHLVAGAPLQQQPFGDPQLPLDPRRALATTLQQFQRFPLELLGIRPILLVHRSLLISPVYDIFCVREIGGRSAYAEQWVRTLREECLDRLIVLNQSHLRRIFTEYSHYYNERRPHQGLNGTTPLPLDRPAIDAPIRRREVLGALIHDYYRAA